MGRGGWLLLIQHFVCRGDLSVSYDGWVAAGRAPAPNENENNEKHGIPDNPPQQRTQGKNTPFGTPLTPMIKTERRPNTEPQGGPEAIHQKDHPSL